MKNVTIYMRRDMNQSKTRRILIHELTHAVEYSFGLKDRSKIGTKI